MSQIGFAFFAGWVSHMAYVALRMRYKGRAARRAYMEGGDEGYHQWRKRAWWL